MKPTHTNDTLLDTKSAAEWLSISPSCLERYRSTGEVRIPFVRIGDRLVRYKLSALQEFADKSTVDA
jgi:hypothetical protein